MKFRLRLRCGCFYRNLYRSVELIVFGFTTNKKYMQYPQPRLCGARIRAPQSTEDAKNVKNVQLQFKFQNVAFSSRTSTFLNCKIFLVVKF